MSRNLVVSFTSMAESMTESDRSSISARYRVPFINIAGPVSISDGPEETTNRGIH